MPSATFTHTVTVAADATVIWRALQEAETWAGIGPIEEVWEAEHTPDGGLASYRWSADAAGRRWEGTAATTKADPLKAMVMALTTAEMRGTIAVTIAPEAEDVSNITVDLQAEATGMLATLFWGVISGAIRSGLPKQVQRFGARLTAS
jgi:carbon monoxide dehydrogenase subunit G